MVTFVRGKVQMKRSCTLDWDSGTTYAFDSTMHGAKVGKEGGVIDDNTIGRGIRNEGSAIGVGDEAERVIGS